MSMGTLRCCKKPVIGNGNVFELVLRFLVMHSGVTSRALGIMIVDLFAVFVSEYSAF